MVLCLTNGLTICVNLWASTEKMLYDRKECISNFLFIGLLMIDNHSKLIFNFSILLESMYSLLFLFDH